MCLKLMYVFRVFTGRRGNRYSPPVWHIYTQNIYLLCFVKTYEKSLKCFNKCLVFLLIHLININQPWIRQLKFNQFALISTTYLHKKIKPTPTSGCYLQFLSSADEFNLEGEIKKKREKLNQESSVNFIKFSLKALVMGIMEIMPATLHFSVKTKRTILLRVLIYSIGRALYLWMLLNYHY